MTLDISQLQRELRSWSEEEILEKEATDPGVIDQKHLVEKDGRRSSDSPEEQAMGKALEERPTEE